MRTRAMFDLKPLLSVMRRTSYAYVPGTSLNVLSPINTLHSAGFAGRLNTVANGTGNACDRSLFHSHFPLPATPFSDTHPSGSELALGGPDPSSADK